jgi:prepilin-type processing-associated H-X9-DG protein
LAGEPAGSGNDLLASQQLALIRCPSDDGDPFLPTAVHYTISTSSPLRGIKTNYDFAVQYWEWRCNAWAKTTSDVRRIFGENSNARIADVLDGTSNTIAMAETTLTNSNGTCPAWAYRGWVQIGVDPAPTQGGGINVWMSNWTLPNPGRPPAQRGKIGSWSWPGSLHPGGCNVTMGDGSVRFIQERTATTVMGKLATMADGQAVSPP